MAYTAIKYNGTILSSRKYNRYYVNKKAIINTLMSSPIYSSV